MRCVIFTSAILVIVLTAYIPVKAVNQDIIAIEKAYSVKNINSINYEYGREVKGFFNYGLGIRKGSGNYHFVLGNASDEDLGGLLMGGKVYTTGCWLWNDETYNPYSKDISYAGRTGFELDIISSIGNLNAGFYWQHWNISKKQPIYELYQNEPQKQWDFNYYFSYNITQKYFDFSTLYSDFYKRIEPAIKYYDIYRSAIYYSKTDDEINKYNDAQMFGIHQEVIVEDDGKTSRYVLLDISYTKPETAIQRSQKIDEYTYRVESFGLIPYIYAGVWYNRELGLGYGVGLGIWKSHNSQTGEEIMLIAKWNEIQEDPIFGKSEGLTVTLYANAMF